MRPRSLLLLLFLALGLSAFIWFYERHLPSSDERREQAKKVLPLKADEVEALDLSWGEQAVRLERRQPAAPADGAKEAEQTGSEAKKAPAGVWYLASPLDTPADGPAVDRLVASLVNLEKRRTVKDADRAQLGLDSPRAKVRIETGKRSPELLVGAELSGSDSMAVALEGRPEVYVVARDLFAEVTKKPGDWRSRELFSGTRYDLQSLTLSAGGHPALRLERLPGGDDFELVLPGASGELTERDLPDRELVDQLTQDLIGLRVVSFLDAPQPPSQAQPSDLGLEPAATEVEATFTDGREPLTLQLGSAAGDGAVYGRRGTQLFTVHSELPELARRPPEQLRSRAWASLATYQVHKVELHDAEGNLTLERQDLSWRRGDDTLDYGPVSDLLYAVTEVQGERLLAASEVASLPAEPLLTLTLSGDDDRSETLSLYPFGNYAAAARSSRRPVVLLVSADKLAELRQRIAAVRSAPAQGKEPAAAATSEEAAPEGTMPAHDGGS